MKKISDINNLVSGKLKLFLLEDGTFSLSRDNTVPSSLEEVYQEEGVSLLQTAITPYGTYVIRIGQQEPYIYMAYGDFDISPSRTKVLKIDKDGTDQWDYTATSLNGVLDLDTSDGVYVGDSNKVVKLNSQGQLQWEHNYAMLQPIIAADTNVYYAESYSLETNSNQIVARDSSGSLLWTQQFQGNTVNDADIYSMTAKDGFLYITGFNYASNVGIVAKWDITTPSVVWEINTINEVWNDIVVDAVGDVYITGFDGFVRKIDGGTGSTTWVWSYDIVGVGRGLHFDGQYIYALPSGTTSGSIVKLNLDGTLVWQSATISKYLQFPETVEDSVYVATTSGLLKRNASDGTDNTPTWQNPRLNDSRIYSIEVRQE